MNDATHSLHSPRIVLSQTVPNLISIRFIKGNNRSSWLCQRPLINGYLNKRRRGLRLKDSEKSADAYYRKTVERDPGCVRQDSVRTSSHTSTFLCRGMRETYLHFATRSFFIPANESNVSPGDVQRVHAAQIWGLDCCCQMGLRCRDSGKGKAFCPQGDNDRVVQEYTYVAGKITTSRQKDFPAMDFYCPVCFP